MRTECGRLAAAQALSWVATIATVRLSQKGLAKLNTMRAWVFGVLFWLLPVKFHSLNNMAQSRPDFPLPALFCLRTAENVALSAVRP